jgi:hypothetical protein
VAHVNLSFAYPGPSLPSQHCLGSAQNYDMICCAYELCTLRGVMQSCPLCSSLSSIRNAFVLECVGWPDHITFLGSGKGYHHRVPCVTPSLAIRCINLFAPNIVRWLRLMAGCILVGGCGCRLARRCCCIRSRKYLYSFCPTIVVENSA